MDMADHQRKQESRPVQQYLDTHSLPDVSSSPSLQTSLEEKLSVESSEKNQQNHSIKTQKLNVPNQQIQTAQSKLTKKNQKQLVGENFERMNYLYQCATRLASLTTLSQHRCNSRASHGTTPYLRKREEVRQQDPGNETNSALMPPISDRASEDNPVIRSRNGVGIDKVASPNRPLSDSDDATESKCPLPTPDTSLSTRFGSDNVSYLGRISSSSDFFPFRCPILNPTEDSSVSYPSTLGSDRTTSTPILLALDNVPSITVSLSSDPDLDSNVNLTRSYHDGNSTVSTSQPGSGIDNIPNPLPPCTDMDCSSTNQTVPCSEMEYTTNLTTLCSELDYQSHPTDSEVGCSTNPVSSCRELASNVSSTCRAVGRKCQLRLSHHMKRQLCRGCSTPLVPALTATAKIIRVRKKRVLSVRCLTCGVRRSRPCQDMKTVWADRCPPTV